MSPGIEGFYLALRQLELMSRSFSGAWLCIASDEKLALESLSSEDMSGVMFNPIAIEV